MRINILLLDFLPSAARAGAAAAAFAVAICVPWVAMRIAAIMEKIGRAGCGD
jgi:hypothetical protein